MSEESPDPEETPRPTPFDHPFFLPVLLFAGTIWFGFDGWFNSEIEAKMFNQVGFFVLLAAFLYTTVKAIRGRSSARD